MENTRNSNARECALPPFEFERLCDILGISDDDPSKARLSAFLNAAGCKTFEDLAFLKKEAFERYEQSLPFILESKLLRVAAFVAQGGSMAELVQSLRATRLSDASSNELQSTTKRTTSPKDNDPVVSLNVGGHPFTTTRQTLCRYPGTLLEAMFSGRTDNIAMKPTLQTKDGTYFIDRNGSQFGHILDFLRVGQVVSLPSDDASREALAFEADYYGLDELVRAIRMPGVDIDEYLPNDVLAMRKDEDTLRKAFMDGTASGYSPHRGLVSLFCPDNDLVNSLPLTYEPMAKDDVNGMLLMDTLHKNQPPPGTPTTVGTLDEFRSNFDQEFPNLLHRISHILREERIIIAGGSVLRALTMSHGIRTADWWEKQYWRVDESFKSDVDLFLYCSTQEEATRITRRIWNQLAVDQEYWSIVRSRGVININSFARWIELNDPSQLKVQIVLRLYDSPSEILTGFDCDSCCCAYDGRSVWMSPRCLRALRTGVNVLNPLHAWPNKPSHELRLAKYAYRGFSVFVPWLDNRRIDCDRIRRMKLRELHGMARLVKVTYEMELAHGTCEDIPHRIRSIQREVLDSLSDAKRVTSGMYTTGLQYDGELTGNVIIPSMFQLQVQDFWERDGGAHRLTNRIPLASECRDEAWNEIADAGESPPDGVPGLLLDGWDTEKRAREYLNSLSMDSYDLNNVYYSGAYKDSVHGRKATTCCG